MYAKFWFLTYDIFHQFQHTNSQLKTLSYSMPLKDLQVVVASHLTPHDIERIREAFFPELDNVDTLKHIVYCPWFNQGQVPNLAQVEGKNARMPYNLAANQIESPALGTRANPQDACPLRSLTQQWTMWQTASRSCVIQLDLIGGKEPAPDKQEFFQARKTDGIAMEFPT
jgi:hypothetical protein